MMARVHRCVVIRLNGVIFLTRGVYPVLLSIIIILMKEITQEFLECIIAEIVGVGRMEEECTHILECG